MDTGGILDEDLQEAAYYYCFSSIPLDGLDKKH